MSPLGGPIAVPSGAEFVCQAGTSLTLPQSVVTVPPMLGLTVFSTPCSPSQPASSVTAMHGAPVRLATATASAVWSEWPWVIRTWVGSTSSALTPAAGLLGARNGSMSTFASPSVSSKVACPMNLICISLLCCALSSSASAQPTATPTIIPIRASSASSMRSGAVALGRVLDRQRVGERLPRGTRRTSRRPRAPGRGSAAGPAPRGRRAASASSKRPGRGEGLDRGLELRVGVAHRRRSYMLIAKSSE